MTTARQSERTDPLRKYRAKRDFTVTPEPAGKVERKARPKKLAFVVQKHDATRLHWDLRLEMDGVLKSWAVTRGPSADPDDKRLAVRTEDHPLTYGKFEGIIPEKEYGGGTVMLWDRGSWEPVPGKEANLDDGHLHFRLHGERMKGEWLLVRLKPRDGDKHENWLLRKVADEETQSGDSLVATALTSVKTGRTMKEIARDKPARTQRKPRSRKPMSLPTPGFRAPMLATLVARVPEGSEWWFEIKYDGYRCLLAVGADGVRAWTRSGLDWAGRYGAIAEAAAAFPCASALIDGEVIAVDGSGRPDFSRLQAELKRPDPDLLFMAFDLLELDGETLEDLPLSERKRQLEALMRDAPEPLRVSAHIMQDGEATFRALSAEGYEGVIAKRADSTYSHARSTAWLKIKGGRREEFVIAGWEPSDKRGRLFRSLLLAQHDAGRLVYKGKVGTGFRADTMADLAQRLERLATRKSPLSDPPKSTGPVRWVRPELVAEVRYAELTSDGLVRHGSYLGLREDKPAQQVVPEAQLSATGLPEAPEGFAITNPQRRLFGKDGPTKGQLAAWYEAIAPFALPWMRDRPLSLVRCPQGLAAPCFFQKHLKPGWGKELTSFPITNAKGETETSFIAKDAAGLLRCVQMGTIEFHGWGASAERIECPDRMVFDLDPAPDVDFTAVVEAALFLREQLSGMGLETFAMVTGGKGVHVIAPLDARQGWDEVEDFAHRFALAVERLAPDRFTASMSKARRKGRIFIDWLRNQRGSTAVLPWSVRARAGAPVAVPVSWSELDGLTGANQFTLAQPDELLERARNLDPGWAKARQTLPQG